MGLNPKSPKMSAEGAVGRGSAPAKRLDLADPTTFFSAAPPRYPTSLSDPTTFLQLGMSPPDLTSYSAILSRCKSSNFQLFSFSFFGIDDGKEHAMEDLPH